MPAGWGWGCRVASRQRGPSLLYLGPALLSLAPLGRTAVTLRGLSSPAETSDVNTTRTTPASPQYLSVHPAHVLPFTRQEPPPGEGRVDYLKYNDRSVIGSER